MNTFLAKINRNSLSILDFGSEANRARWVEWTKKHNGEEIRITLQKPLRSVSQNNLYWMYLGLIEKETGNDANDLHEFFKRKFLPPVNKSILNTDIKLPGSTAELDKTYFSEYLDKISALTNVPIPDTEEFRKFLDEAPEFNDEYNPARRTEVNEPHLQEPLPGKIPDSLHDTRREELERELRLAGEESVEEESSSDDANPRRY